MRHYLAEDFRAALLANGIAVEGSDAPDYGIHSWRCHYYRDIPTGVGGPCDCFEELVLDLVDVVNRRRPVGVLVVWAVAAILASALLLAVVSR